jgi:hypothetical protein
MSVNVLRRCSRLQWAVLALLLLASVDVPAAPATAPKRVLVLHKRAIATDLLPAVDAILAGRRFLPPFNPLKSD